MPANVDEDVDGRLMEEAGDDVDDAHDDESDRGDRISRAYGRHTKRPPSLPKKCPEGVSEKDYAWIYDKNRSVNGKDDGNDCQRHNDREPRQVCTCSQESCAQDLLPRRLHPAPE